MEKSYYVYLFTNKHNGTLYCGMTVDLARRIHEHQHNLIDGFTKRYGLKQLVYYEVYPSHDEAFHRERQLKNWTRDWKKQLIEKDNREWKDLSNTLQ